MTAAHCFEKHNDYYDKKNIYVGTHEKQTKGSTGHIVRRDKIYGIFRNGTNMTFPIPNKSCPQVRPVLLCIPLYSTKKELLDIAIILLTKPIDFTKEIKQVRLERPKPPNTENPLKNNDCLNCYGDCEPSNLLTVYGWGKVTPGTQKIVISN